MKNYGIMASVYERTFNGEIYQWKESLDYKKDAIRKKEYYKKKGYSVAITTQRHGRKFVYDIWVRK